jgi:preprotein translocase subunit SecG
MEKETEDILIDQGGQRASIHTVNEDISKALSGSSARVVKKAISVAKEQEEIEHEKTLDSNLNKFLFGLAILFLVTSIGFLIWSIQKKGNNVTVDPIIAYQGLVTYEQVQVIGDFESKPSLMNQKFKDAEAVVASKGITRFRFKNVDPVNTTNLIEAFGWKPGPKFLGGLENTFDFGIYFNGEKKSPFIMFKTNGSDQSFSGFSLWEDNVLFDLGQMFSINAQTAFDPIYQKKFENITIESHDGRVLYDADNNPILIMIFIDDTHALITNSKQAVVEILNRLLLKK